jgi:hypothetical protein
VKYRQFFSTCVLATCIATPLGLVLSLPASFTVEIVHADKVVSTTHYTSTITNLLTAVPTPTSTAPAQSENSSLLKPTTNTLVTPTEPVPVTNKKRATPAITAPDITKTNTVFTVPFYSQLTDVTSPAWKKVACGITSLAMLIEYYHPNKIASVDTLLNEGIAEGAYNDSVGWSYNGLITVAKKYGLGGSTHDYKNSSMEVAFKAFSQDLQKGPIMASVHYTFKSSNPIPHLVIINGIKDGLVYYNDPAADAGGGSISIAQFKEGWKKRYIEFYETT